MSRAKAPTDPLAQRDKFVNGQPVVVTKDGPFFNEQGTICGPPIDGDLYRVEFINSPERKMATCFRAADLAPFGLAL